MATSGTITSRKIHSAFGGDYVVKVSWNMVEQSQAGCSSIISMHCWVEADDPIIELYPAEGRYFNVLITDYTGEHSVFYEDYIVCPTGSSPNVSFDIFQDLVTEVAHVYDGTETFSISVEFQPDGDSEVIFGNSFALPNIDVMPIVTASGDAFIGQVVGISVNNVNGFTYTYDLKATIGGTDVAIANNVSAGTTQWNTSTQKASLYASIPNADHVAVPIKCVVKYGTSTIGTQNASITLNADPVDSAPTFTGAGYQDTNATTIAITLNNQKIVRGHSIVQMLATALTAKYGATLVSAVITINGTSYTDTSISGQASVANWTKSIGTLDVSSNTTASITLTDSRGMTSEESISILVLDYHAPRGDCSARRVDNYYSETDIRCNANISSIDGHNTSTITLAYKKSTDGSYPTPETITSGVTYQRNLDNAYRWNVKFVISDLLETTTIIINVDVGMPLVFFDHVRSSMGVNCFPTRNNSIESEGLQIDNNICVGMATLSAEKTTISGANEAICYGLGLELITGLFQGISVPNAYTKKYKITAQVSTTSTNTASITMGGIASNALSTGGNARKIVVTGLFSESDLTQETTPDGSGLLLKGVNTGTGTSYIYNVCVACYLCK